MDFSELRGGPPSLDFDFDVISLLCLEGFESDPFLFSGEGIRFQLGLGHLGLLGSQQGNVITLYPLAILASVMKDEEVSKHPDGLHESFRKRTIEVLAHEVGHWRAQRRYPRIYRFDGMIGVWGVPFAWRFLVFCIVAILGFWIELASKGWGWLPTALGFSLLLSDSAQKTIARIPSAIQSLHYKLSWNEFMANRYADSAMKDPRWDKACSILDSSCSDSD